MRSEGWRGQTQLIRGMGMCNEKRGMAYACTLDQEGPRGHEQSTADESVGMLFDNRHTKLNISDNLNNFIAS
jgi:hypothetical protein